MKVGTPLPYAVRYRNCYAEAINRLMRGMASIFMIFTI